MLAKLLSAAGVESPVVSRRSFILGAAASATGLAVGFRVSLPAQAANEAGVHPFEAYVEIDADGTVTVHSAHFEMGQGSYQGVATLVVEELGADWDAVTVKGASGNTAAYGNLAWGGVTQGTGGSTAMASSWDRYRRAGAAAREMLKAAAAEAWGVSADEVTVDRGTLSHPSGSRASFGELAAQAARMPVPTDPPLKARADWTEIGNESLKRYDRAGKADGSETFTIDIKLPGMLTAVPVHPPRFGATVRSFDATAARDVPGVTDVVETPRGLAVVASHTWAALKGREAVTVDWDETEAETRGSDEILTGYRERAADAPDAIARSDGDAEAAFSGAATVVEATYSFPFLAHAALEPLNAVVQRAPDGTIEVWGGHQIPDFYQAEVAKLAGVPIDQVRLHVMKTGGSFGRRAVGDADVVLEATAAAMALDWQVPVKVQWTREDDMAAGRFRPAYVHRLRAGLDADGNLIAWNNHIVGQSILAGTPFAGFIQNGIDLSSVEGANTLPYAIPNLEVGLTTTDVRVPVLWWRAVGSTHTAFATEAFFDEVAEAVGKDPVAFRLSLLGDHPRHVATLNLLAELADWGGPVPEGRARGVALHESFGSVVGQIAEVSVDGADVHVHRVWCAVDCGTAINPDTIRSQMEGSVGFGLGSILTEAVTLTDGVVDQRNYDRYQVLRYSQMPEVVVRIVPSTAPPSGVGEPGVPPIGPAVANAVAAATGRRIRDLPFARGLV